MGTCGVGGWVGPLPGDPDNNLSLSAVPVFGGIQVSYTYPALNPHAVAYAKLFRSTSSNFTEALNSVILHGNTYYDKLDSGDQYWYWLQVFSVNGTPGAIIGPATAIARPLIADLISQLSGAIDSGLLSNSLKADIDKIALNYNDMIGRLQLLAGDDAALADALASLQSGVAEALALTINETTIRQQGQAALVEQIDAIAALNSDTAAAVIEERDARVDQYGALAQQISELTTANASDTVQAGLLIRALAKIVGGDALVQQITTGQVAFGDQVAAVETASTASVESLGDKVTQIGAQYTAKVKVNGLIGGFGVYNDGTEVQAGFDVDNFWVGRTGTDQKKPFIVKDGEVFINEAAIDSLTIGKLRDESGRLVVENGSLAIRNAAGEIIFSAGTPLDWSNVGGATKPQDGATRNVFRGNWTQPTEFAVGDVVIDSTGYGWSCTAAHTSSNVLKTPVYPTFSNDRWTLYTVKGNPGETFLLSLSDSSIVRDPAGVYSKSSVTVKAFKLGENSLLGPYAGRIYIQTTTDRVNFQDYYSSQANESSTVFTIPAGIKEAKILLFAENVDNFYTTPPLQAVTLPILDDATVYTVKIVSSNGVVFRKGEARQTTLVARVFRNGEEITDELSPISFKWSRKSMDPQPPPNDDESWNQNHQAGFKSIVVSVDDVFARATFNCDVSF